ncbi:O-antigen polymerase [Roseateles sp.]|jgi:oligosaccharide repeat unit polymerase|uniref:O-antigen polymerase n=1 Tax=Roseateles sp. TaxID=1971397 RepID=UPI0037C89DC0
MEAAVLFLLLLTMAAIGLTSAIFTRDRLHPAPMHAAVWTLVCATYLLFPHRLRPLSPEVFMLIVLAIASFSLAAVIRPADPPNGALRSPRRYRVTIWREVLFTVALLGFVPFLLKAQALAQSAPYTESDFINLRIALTGALDDAQTFGLLGYLIPVSFASTFVELASSKKRLFGWRGWISLLLSVVYALMSTGRTYFFLLVTALAFIALLQHRARLAQIASAALLLFSLAFFGLGMLANKIGADTPNIDALSAVDALMLYLLGGIAAFDLTLGAPPALEWGLNAMRTPLAVLQALGADVTVVPLVKEYVNVPLPTNVYSALQPYHADFGWLGIVGFYALCGLLHGRLYRAAQRPEADPRVIIYASMAMYPLLLQFFQDQYLSLLSTWVTFVLLIAPAFRANESTAPQPSTLQADRTNRPGVLGPDPC